MTMTRRRKLGHTPPSWVPDGSVYFITICVEPRGRNHLAVDAVAEPLFRSIDFNRERGLWWPHVVLLMPDHLHGVFTFAKDPGMKTAISNWKHYTSRVLGIDWQRDFFDHRLRNHESVDEKIHYIRMNPVRAGLADSPDGWRFVRNWKTRITL